MSITKYKNLFIYLICFLYIYSLTSTVLVLKSEAALSTEFDIGDVIDINGNGGNSYNFSLVNISDYLSHVFDSNRSLISSGLGYLYNKVVDDGYCPKSSNHRHNFVYGLTRKNGVDGYFNYCDYCGQFSGDLVQQEYNTIENGKLYKDNVEWKKASAFTLCQIQGSSCSNLVSSIREGDSASSFSYDGATGTAEYNNNGIVIKVNSVGSSYGRQFSLRPIVDNGYTLDVSRNLPITFKVSNVNGFGGGSFTTYSYFSSTRNYAFGPALNWNNWQSPYIFVLHINEYYCMYKVVNFWDSSFSGATYNNINAPVVKYDENNDQYIYMGNMGNIISFDNNTFTMPGGVGKNWNEIEIDMSKREYDLTFEDEIVKVIYTNDGVYIYTYDLEGNLVSTEKFYIYDDLELPYNNVDAPPLIDENGDWVVNYEYTGTLDFKINQVSSDTDAYITTNEDIPQGIRNLRESLATMFVELPEMTGEVTDFMQEGFSYIPQEVTTLIIFGVSVAVFVGIFKLFWR